MIAQLASCSWQLFSQRKCCICHSCNRTDNKGKNFEEPHNYYLLIYDNFCPSQFLLFFQIGQNIIIQQRYETKKTSSFDIRTIMNMKEVKRKVITQESSSILQHIFNNFLIMDMNSLVIGQPIQEIPEIQENSLIEALGTVQGVTKAVRLLKMKDKRPERRIHPRPTISDIKISSLIFCRPVKYSLKDEKVFWIMRDKNKKKLKLDNPKATLILPNDYFMTIERKYINLYEVDENLDLSLKDFDSSGIGKKFSFVDMKHLTYKNKNYVIIFGNSKESTKVYFSGLVFEVTRGKLKFIKKNLIAPKEILSPTIIFDTYPNQSNNQKFCLVIGGTSDQIEDYYYNSLKIDLHLFMTQFLNYSPNNTDEIPFTNRRNLILSGKAIYFKENWYVFCSEEQTVNQIILIYGGPGKSLTCLDIRSQPLGLKDKLYFTEDSIHEFYEKEEDKIVFVDKQMDLKQRTIQGILYKFM